MGKIKLVEFKSNRKTEKKLRVWHIYEGEVRVGKVSIEGISPFSGYIDMLISVKHRGKGIGSTAFRKVCEESGCKKVIAEVRKSNAASIKALRNAGFRESDETKSKQLVFVWKKIK